MSDTDEPQPRPPESVLEVIGRKTGEVPRISLSEAGELEDGERVSLDPKSDVAFGARSRGSYQVLGEVARGGMGAVLRGHDTDLRRDVAIKVLDDRLAGRPEVVQRFVEEAQIGAQLQHPGVVPVYELGLMADERPFFTMKLVKGRTLASLLAARKSPDSDQRHFLSIFEQICQTIAYAHSKGVLHRDIKPANVMVGAFGEVQVVDWGLAKVLGQGGVVDEVRALRDQNTVIDTVRSGPGSSGSDSLVGSVMGTPAYMAPEQARGEVDELDERADVFALGALLCELLTGKAPYLEGGEHAVVIQAARAMLAPARERLEACGADETLRQLALDCMAAAPQARPASAGEVARAVQEHLASAENRAREAQLEATEARVRVREERKRRRLAVALGGTVVTLLLALGAGYVWAQGQREERREGLRRQVDGLQAAALELQAEARHDDAVAKAREALGLTLEEGLGEQDRARVASFVDLVERAASEAREAEELAARNAELFERLGGALLLRTQIGVSATVDEVDNAYREAFEGYGLDVESEDLVATLEALRERGMGEQLALSIDDWARIRRAMFGWTSPEAEALTALAADLDPDPLRTDVRAALLERDTGELFRIVEELDVEDAPPATTWVLAGAVNDVGGNASELLERAVRRHPGDERFRVLLGFVHRRGERNAQALRQFEAAHALRPENVYVIQQLAELAEDLGDFPTAVRLYRELESRLPASDAWAGSLGLCLLLLGLHDECIAVLERPRSAGSLDWADRLHLASARHSAGLTSVAEFEDVAMAIGTDPYVHQILAWTLSVTADPARRDPARAEFHAQEASRVSSTQWLTSFVLATSALSAEHWTDALEALAGLRPFQAQRGDNAFSCAAMRAIAHHHLGEGEDAREWLAQAQVLFERLARGEPEAWHASSYYAQLAAAEALIE